jgi:SSS family solute:Na+ symporter
MMTSAYFAIQSNGLFGLFKMTMMFNSILAASFWLGMLWRKSNAAGAWASMVVMFVATVVLPFGMPLIPGVRTSEYLGKTTQAIPVSRIYTAREMDVQDRERAIAKWDRLNAAAMAEGLRPELLKAGEKFKKEVLLPKKSIFWSEGFEFQNGKSIGRGNLKVELIALDCLGWDLSKNTYSLNETLTFLFRIFIPFLVLFLVALLTQAEDKDRLDQFFGKMLTPVVGTHEDDDHEMELTRANPNRFAHLKLFPNSNWEFRRWNREDWLGVGGACLAAVSVVVLLIVIIGLGS